MMTYKGYAAIIEYSPDDECLVGHIAGIRDIVGFHGDSISEIREAFIEAVDDYLELCAEMGKEPDKPYSGKILLRISPELHAKTAAAASAHGKSLNQYVADVLMQSHGGKATSAVSSIV